MEEIEKLIAAVEETVTYRGGRATLPSTALAELTSKLRQLALTISSSGVKKCPGCESGEIGSKPDPRGFLELLCPDCAVQAQVDVDNGVAEIAPGFTPVKTPKPQPIDPLAEISGKLADVATKLEVAIANIAKANDRIATTETKVDAFGNAIEAQNARIAVVDDSTSDLRKRLTVAAKALGKDS